MRVSVFNLGLVGIVKLPSAAIVNYLIKKSRTYQLAVNVILRLGANKVTGKCALPQVFTVAKMKPADGNT
jgi:hypothetical protein